MAVLLQGSPEEIKLLSEWLRADQVAALPTETVYGLGGNALSSDACKRIFAAKERPSWDPLIVHVDSVSSAQDIVVWNEQAQRLADHFWPGPLTLILPGRGKVAPEVSAGKSTVAVRMPAHSLFLEVLKVSGLPLAAPSANPFGYLSPTRAEDVQTMLGERIRYILDGGPCEVGVESTIIDLSRETPRILRPGRVGREELAQVLNTDVEELLADAHSHISDAPGLAPWHYSPRKPLRLWDSELESLPELQAGEWLFRTRTVASGSGEQGIALFSGKQPDIEAVARNLYHALLKADRDPECTQITVESPGEATALHKALSQRLRKAAARYPIR